MPVYTLYIGCVKDMHLLRLRRTSSPFLSERVRQQRVPHFTPFNQVNRILSSRKPRPRCPLNYAAAAADASTCVTYKRREERSCGNVKSFGESLALMRPLPPAEVLALKAREQDSRTVVQPRIWLKEEPSQFSMGQTSQSLACSIVEKPRTGVDECPKILLSCFRARNSAPAAL